MGDNDEYIENDETSATQLKRLTRQPSCLDFPCISPYFLSHLGDIDNDDSWETRPFSSHLDFSSSYQKEKKKAV